jgi:hypothetical protein
MIGPPLSLSCRMDGCGCCVESLWLQGPPPQHVVVIPVLTCARACVACRRHAGRIPEAPPNPEAVRNTAKLFWFVVGTGVGHAAVSGAYLEENFPRLHQVGEHARASARVNIVGGGSSAALAVCVFVCARALQVVFRGAQIMMFCSASAPEPTASDVVNAWRNVLGN